MVLSVHCSKFRMYVHVSRRIMKPPLNKIFVIHFTIHLPPLYIKLIFFSDLEDFIILIFWNNPPLHYSYLDTFQFHMGSCFHKVFNVRNANVNGFYPSYNKVIKKQIYPCRQRSVHLFLLIWKCTKKSFKF